MNLIMDKSIELWCESTFSKTFPSVTVVSDFVYYCLFIVLYILNCFCVLCIFKFVSSDLFARFSSRFVHYVLSFIYVSWKFFVLLVEEFRFIGLCSQNSNWESVLMSVRDLLSLYAFMKMLAYRNFCILASVCLTFYVFERLRASYGCLRYNFLSNILYYSMSSVVKPDLLIRTADYAERILSQQQTTTWQCVFECIVGLAGEINGILIETAETTGSITVSALDALDSFTSRFEFGERDFHPMGEDFCDSGFVEFCTARRDKYRIVPRGNSTVKDVRLRSITLQQRLEHSKTFSTKLYEPAPKFKGRSEKVYGRTWFAGREYMFPVTCDVYSFCVFVNIALEKHYDAAVQLFIHGILMESLRPLYSEFLMVPQQPCRRFNLMGPEFDSSSNGDMLDRIALFSSISLVCHLAYSGDTFGLASFFGTRQDWTASLIKILNLESISALLEWIKSCFIIETTGEWTVFDALPSNVRHSKIVLSLTRLITFLTLSSFTSEDSLLGSIMSRFDFRGVTEKVFSTVLITQVLYSIVQGLERLVYGNEFWGLTKDVSFTRSANEILGRKDFSLSIEEAPLALSEIDALMKSRDNLRDSAEISRLKDKLVSRALEINRLVRNNSPRVPTIPIWLNGEPGVGKTTLIDSIVSRLSVKDGIPRKFGDIIYYNIHDKFPVESGALCDARYMVINDIRNDYSNDQKNNIRPLDTVLQQLIDTSPVELSQAFDKGVLFYNLQYVLISSNHRQYRFAADSEKLVRRLHTGPLFDIRFNTRNKSFAEIQQMAQSARNSSLTFAVQGVRSDGQRLCFEDTRVCYSNYSDFFSHIEGKISETMQSHAKHDLLFVKQTCKCGIPIAIHVRDDEYMSLNADCDILSFPAIIPTVIQLHSLEVRDNVSQNAVQVYPDDHIVTSAEDLPEDQDFTQMTLDFSPASILFYSFATYLAFLALHRLRILLDQICVLLAIVRDELSGIAQASVSDVVVLCDRLPTIRRIFVRDSTFNYLRAVNSLSVFYSKVKSFLYKNKAFLLAALGVGSLGLYIQSRKKIDETGEIAKSDLRIRSKVVMRTGEVQNPTVDRKKRDWASTEPYQAWRLHTLGVKEDDLESLCRIAIQTFTISHTTVSGERRSKQALGFVINGSTVLFNKHTFQDGFKYVSCHIEHNGTQSFITEKDLTEHADSEIVSVLNVWYTDYKDLSKFLPAKRPIGSCQVNSKYLGPNGTISTISNTSACILGKVTYPTSTAKVDIKKGDCMSPLLCEIGGTWFIGGFLIAEETSMFKQCAHFSALIATDFTTYEERSAPSEVVYERFPSDLSPLSSVSQWNKFRLREIKPLGTDQAAFGASFRSRLQRTILYDDIHGKLSEPYGYPSKVGGMVNGEYKSSWTNTFKHFDLQDLSSFALRKEASESYARDCLLNAQGTALRPLTIQEAFQGEREMGVDKIKYKTSCGKTWRAHGFRNKLDLFTEIEEGVFEIDEEFLESIDEILERLNEGVATSIVVDLVHKDEVRPLSKLDDYKIRLFSVLDADVNIIYRMYFMPLISYLLANPYVSECFGQLNAASKQWTDLANHLQKHGDLCIDMDFASFDTSHSSATFAGVAYFFSILAPKLGYTLQETKVVGLLVHMLNLQIMSYSSDYFFKSKGMPSGVVLTLILNSIVNSVMSRMAFKVLTGKDCSEYRNFVSTATVGDDNASNVSSLIIDKFNVIAIQPLYLSWGYIVTPAQKNSEMVKSMTLSEITFVKRKFVQREDGFFLAPLNVDSIYKAFCFEERNDERSVQRLANVYHSAIREAFLHGESFFMEFDAWIKCVFAKHNIECPVVAYQDISDDFLTKGFITEWA